jgi:hypothetical protein
MLAQEIQVNMKDNFVERPKNNLGLSNGFFTGSNMLQIMIKPKSVKARRDRFLGLK